jgi:dihydrofolate reductase
MYETLAVWETDPSFAAISPVMRDYAEIWQAMDKIVYSRTLPAAYTARTRIEREFDPEAVRRLKQTSQRDISIAGSELAGQAFKFGLIDEYQLMLWPVVLGGGKPALPSNVPLMFKLLEERRFQSGMVYLRYQTQP